MNRNEITADNYSVKDFFTIAFELSNQVSISRYCTYIDNEEEIDKHTKDLKKKIQEKLKSIHSLEYQNDHMEHISAEKLDRQLDELVEIELDLLIDHIHTSETQNFGHPLQKEKMETDHFGLNQAVEKFKKIIQEDIRRFYSVEYRNEWLEEISVDELDLQIAESVENQLDLLIDSVQAAEIQRVTDDPEKLKPKEWEPYFISQSYSAMNEVHISPALFDIVRYHLSETIKHTLLSLSSIYETLDFASDAQYEDFAFYHNDQLIASICSHEGYATLYLSSEEYEAFKEIIEKNELKRTEDAEPEIGYILSDEAIDKFMDLQFEKEMTESKILSFLEKHGRLAKDDETPTVIFIPTEEDTN